MERCVYCGERRGNKIGCCGENHWDDIPDCPACGSDNTEAEGNLIYCLDCKASWSEGSYTEGEHNGKGE